MPWSRPVIWMAIWSQTCWRGSAVSPGCVSTRGGRTVSRRGIRWETDWAGVRDLC
jgi:hypothetical protein